MILKLYFFSKKIILWLKNISYIHDPIPALGGSQMASSGLSFLLTLLTVTLLSLLFSGAVNLNIHVLAASILLALPRLTVRLLPPLLSLAQMRESLAWMP